MTLEQIKADESQYLMHTYGRFNVALVKGKGAKAWDESGKEYIDFTSGIGVNCLGYSDDGWVKAVSDQAAALQHISNLYYSPLQTELAKKLCKATGFSKVFLPTAAQRLTSVRLSLQESTALKSTEKKEQKL